MLAFICSQNQSDKAATMYRWVGLLVIVLFLLPEFVFARSSGHIRKTTDLIVIHTIGGPSCRNSNVYFPPITGDANNWLSYFRNHKTIGIHYVIGRKGEMLADIPENQVANHAFGNNQSSIGIELVNNGDGKDEFPPQQISALTKLLCKLMATYHISAHQIRGHSELDNRMIRCGRSSYKEKVDPNLAFPWRRVKDQLMACPYLVK